MIVVIDMAISALHLQVKSRQRETALRVVERGGLPGDRTVAHGAIRRKTR